MSEVTRGRQPSTTNPLSRRKFLSLGAMTGGALLLAACGGAAAPAATAVPPTATPVPPDPTATPEPAAVEAAPAAEGEVEVMVGDVLDYVLESEEWPGDYGSVTFSIHEALHNGESAYYIRTDASDPTVAEEIGLVFVPLLNTAALIENVNMFYDFGDAQPAVIQRIPGDELYASLFKVVPVTVNDDSVALDSAEAVEAAAESGAVTLEESNLFVNYPLVKWAGGELSVDADLEGVLPGGQLFEPVNVDEMTATFKLHQCFPGSRYILTDTAMEGMAGMMNIPASAPTQQLQDSNGTDEIWVFGNGIPGPGVMGFQPAIFDNKAGQPAWSPFWDHRTLVWADESQARVLTDSTEVRAAIEAGEVEEFMGVPDTHPNGFVVNCPAPILAPNTFQG